MVDSHLVVADDCDTGATGSALTAFGSICDAAWRRKDSMALPGELGSHGCRARALRGATDVRKQNRLSVNSKRVAGRGEKTRGDFRWGVPSGNESCRKLSRARMLFALVVVGNNTDDGISHRGVEPEWL